MNELPAVPHRTPLVLLPAVAALVAALLPGCTDGAPPFEELPLRDVLRAEPAVVASLPAESRGEIAERLLEPADPLDPDPDEQPLSPSPGRSVASLVHEADAQREAGDADALVLARLRDGDGAAVLDALAAPEDGAAPPARLWLAGAEEAETGTLEQQALDGRAGAILAWMGAEPGTTRLVRVTGWPVGVVATQNVFYVNASWLVALSGEAPAGATPAPPGAPPPGGDAPASRPLSVDVNPYHLPDSIQACAADVLETCECAPSSCSGAPTDPAFPSANAECAWVEDGAEPLVNAEALCALALMSVDAIADCMSQASYCIHPAPADHTQAVTFVSDEDCFRELTSCLQTGMPELPVDTYSACDACDPCGDDCVCDSDNWGTCYSGRAAPEAGSADAAASHQGCTVAAGRPRACRHRSAPATPAGWLWLLLPPMYVLRRARRRA